MQPTLAAMYRHAELVWRHSRPRTVTPGSGLERWRFHNAVKAARHPTPTPLANGRVGAHPMAYFVAVLAGGAAHERIKAGVPLPRGW